MHEEATDHVSRFSALWQVGDWVSTVGLDQYRRKFVHHGISGALLGQLTTEQLKACTLNSGLRSHGI